MNKDENNLLAGQSHQVLLQNRQGEEMQGIKTVREDQNKEHLSAEDRKSQHQPGTGDNQAMTSDHHQVLASVVSPAQLLAGNHANWTMAGLYPNMAEMLPSHMNSLIYPNPAFASSAQIGLPSSLGIGTMCHVPSVSASISSSLALSPSSIYNTPNIFTGVPSAPGIPSVPGVASGMQSLPGVAGMPSLSDIPSIPGGAPIAALQPTLNALGTPGFVPPGFFHPSMINAIPNIYGLNGYPYMSVLPGFGGIPFPVPPYQYNHLQHLLPTHQPGSMNLSHLMIPSALPQPLYPGLNSMQPTQPTAGAVSCPQHSETSTGTQQQSHDASLFLQQCAAANAQQQPDIPVLSHPIVQASSLPHQNFMQPQYLSTLTDSPMAAYGSQLLQPNLIPVTLMSQNDSTNTDTLLRSTMAYPNVIPQSHPHSQPSIAGGDGHGVQPLNNIRTISENSSISDVD